MKTLLTILCCVLSPLSLAGQWSAIEGKFDCPALSNSLECALLLERKLVNVQLVRTDNNALEVTLDSGHQRVLSAKDTTYVAVEVLPRRRLLIVFEQLPEGGRFGWLDLGSGAYRLLPGYPLFAPEGDLVVMAEQDVEAGYSPNVLEIHRFSQGKLSRVHTVETPDWGPAQVRWTSAHTLKFRKVSFQCAVEGIPTCPEFELERASLAD